MRRFWLVWCKGKSVPKVQHETFCSAKGEAERLAKLNPDERFYVLECVGAAVVQTVKWTDFKYPDVIDPDDIPF